MKVLAIDPGPTESAFVVYDPHGDLFGRKVFNDEMLRILADPVHELGSGGAFIDDLAIEMVASFGMPVGSEVFQTCVAIGRFEERWLMTRQPSHVCYVYRKDVKMHLCGQTAKVNDAVIRQALIDKFGPEKRKAIGTRGAPGPLFGITGDVWQALAVAVTYAETRQESP